LIYISNIDYSALDRPEIVGSLFHPRPEWGGPGQARSGEDILIPVEEGVGVGARFHMMDKSTPNILFFHGNGEIVADYDDLAGAYNQIGINFMPVDYRGYGRSTGRPTVTSMMRDSHLIFEFVKRWLGQRGYGGPLILMGRSLGSASALELASNHAKDVAGLIIESGFAFSGPLLRLLGIDLDTINFTEEMGLGNLDKIGRFDKPTLIIHAEMDHIIPFGDGQALYEASPASDKTLLRIPGANHNDIFIRGLSEYMTAVGTLAHRVRSLEKVQP